MLLLTKLSWFSILWECEVVFSEKWKAKLHQKKNDEKKREGSKIRWEEWDALFFSGTLNVHSRKTLALAMPLWLRTTANRSRIWMLFIDNLQRLKKSSLVHQRNFKWMYFRCHLNGASCFWIARLIKFSGHWIRMNYCNVLYGLTDSGRQNAAVRFNLKISQLLNDIWFGLIAQSPSRIQYQSWNNAVVLFEASVPIAAVLQS